MDLSETFTKPLKDFAKNSIRLVKRCSKPDIKGKQKVHRSVCVCVCVERERKRERERRRRSFVFSTQLCSIFWKPRRKRVCVCVFFLNDNGLPCVFVDRFFFVARNEGYFAREAFERVTNSVVLQSTRDFASKLS